MILSLYAALVVIAIVTTMARFGIFGFYAAVAPVFTVIAAYEFYTDKQALQDGGASPDSATIGLLGLSGLDWILIAAVTWLLLAVCIFLIRSGLVDKHGVISRRLMCGPWF